MRKKILLSEDQPLLSCKEKKRKKGNITFVDFEVIQDHIGHISWYLILLVALAYYVPLLNGVHQLSSIFLLEVFEHRCWISGVDDNTICRNVSYGAIREYYIPKTEKGSSHCERFNHTFSGCIKEVAGYLNETEGFSVVKCDSYVYNTPSYRVSAVTEFDLVCDRQLLGSTLSAVFFLGALIGILAIGNLSDYVGRRNAVTLTQVAIIGVCIGSSYSSNVLVLAITRFFTGLLIAAGFSTSFIYVVEITGEKWRILVGTGIHAAFGVGCIALSAMAYQWQNWRQLLFATAMLSVPSVVFCLLMPESPRWLFSKGKIAEGKSTTKKIAKKTCIYISDAVWESATSQKLEETTHYYPPTVLFRGKKIRMVTFRLLFLWLVIKMAFFVITLNVGTFSGNIYINNAMSGLSEIVAVPLTIWGMQKFGRNALLSASLVAAGVMFLASSVAKGFSAVYADLRLMENIFVQLGKLGVSIAYEVIFIYSAELYPTVVRGTALGTASTFGSLASVAAPYALSLQGTVPWIIGTLCGVLSISGGIVCRSLPETRGQPLLTTLEEAEEFY